VVAGGRTFRAVHISSARPGFVTPRGCLRVPFSEAPFVYAETPLQAPVAIR
jgi:hypothetical protein